MKRFLTVCLGLLSVALLWGWRLDRLDQEQRLEDLQAQLLDLEAESDSYQLLREMNQLGLDHNGVDWLNGSF